jgi:hypothetical protein
MTNGSGTASSSSSSSLLLSSPSSSSSSSHVKPLPPHTHHSSHILINTRRTLHLPHATAPTDTVQPPEPATAHKVSQNKRFAHYKSASNSRAGHLTGPSSWNALTRPCSERRGLGKKDDIVAAAQCSGKLKRGRDDTCLETSRRSGLYILPGTDASNTCQPGETSWM